MIDQKGYSLIELLVSMVIGFLILIGLYGVFEQNQKTYHSQQQINTMTGQVRSALDTMARTIRSAGNNRRALKLSPAVYIAESDAIRILSDLPQDYNGDGDTIDFTAPGTGDDEDENGDQQINDSGEDTMYFLNGTQLIQRSFSNNPPVETGDGVTLAGIDPDPNPLPPEESDIVLADNVVALSFQYFMASPGETNNSELVTPIIPANLNLIQIVRIRLIAQTRNPDRESGRFHTIDLQTEVELRNR